MSRNGEYAAYAAAFILFILLLFKLYAAIDFFFGTPLQVTSETPKISTIETLPPVETWHLFGQYKPEIVDAHRLPKASVNLRLYGVFMATPTQSSRAVISISGGGQNVYEAGDTIPGSGARIYQILSDSVIISYNNRLEALSLPKEELPLGALPSSLNLEQAE